MKIILSVFAVAAFAVAAVAQDGPKVVAEITGRPHHTPVKDAPFSADTVSESIQTLADGNRIVRTTTGKFYRNSAGRIRREMTGGSGGIMGGADGFGPGVSIMDRTGFRYMLDDGMKTAQQIPLLPMKELSIVRTVAPLTDEQKKAIEKLRSEIKMPEGGKLTDEQKAELEKLHIKLKDIQRSFSVTGGGEGGGFGHPRNFHERVAKFETRTEELGTRNVEGVEATGTRKITTIPANAIGNERPIEIVYERWFSKALGVVVYSKNTDPRFGEQTYRLINIVRSEPEPSLFNLPQGYKVITENLVGPTYPISTSGRGTGNATTVVRTMAKPK